MPRRSGAPDAAALAESHGAAVVRVADLERLGLQRSTIARRCGPGGPWQRLMPGVVLLRTGPPTRDDRRRAAILHAGAGAVLTGADAMALHGLRRMPAPSGPVHLLVPHSRRCGASGRVLAERTHRLPVPVPGRWPLAPPERALLDYARRSTCRSEVRAAVAEVVQRGLAAPAALVAELRAGSGRGTALPRAVLEEIGAGVRSAAEADARELLERSALPPPRWNHRVVDAGGRLLAVPDAWWEEVAMAWEIDSVEYHLSPADYARTVERRSALAAQGVVVVQTLPSAIRARGPAVLAELGSAYAAAARRPRPSVRGLLPHA